MILKISFILCIVCTLSFAQSQFGDSLEDHNLIRGSLDLTDQLSDLINNNKELEYDSARIARSSSSENHNPSYNLHKHSLHYEPHGYKMIQYSLSSKKHVVSFTYQVS